MSLAVTTRPDWTGRLLLVLVLCGWSLLTAAAESEYRVKSAYLYNFSRLTQLPPQRFEQDNDYHLCIAGKNPFGPFLSPLRARPVSGHPLSIDLLNNRQELPGCEMLFISRSEKRELDAWLTQAARYQVLTVSDIEGFAGRGGIIGLVTHGNRIRFEINHEVAKDCGITISAKLLELGKLVDTERKEGSPCRL